MVPGVAVSFHSIIFFCLISFVRSKALNPRDCLVSASTKRHLGYIKQWSSAHMTWTDACLDTSFLPGQWTAMLAKTLCKYFNPPGPWNGSHIRTLFQSALWSLLSFLEFYVLGNVIVLVSFLFHMPLIQQVLGNYLLPFLDWGHGNMKMYTFPSNIYPSIYLSSIKRDPLICRLYAPI